MRRARPAGASAVETLDFLESCVAHPHLAGSLISGTSDGLIRFWNPSNAALLLQLDAIHVPLRPRDAASISVSGKLTTPSTQFAYQLLERWRAQTCLVCDCRA